MLDGKEVTMCVSGVCKKMQREAKKKEKRGERKRRKKE